LDHRVENGDGGREQPDQPGGQGNIPAGLVGDYFSPLREIGE